MRMLRWSAAGLGVILCSMLPVRVASQQRQQSPATQIPGGPPLSPFPDLVVQSMSAFGLQCLPGGKQLHLLVKVEVKNQGAGVAKVPLAQSWAAAKAAYPLYPLPLLESSPSVTQLKSGETVTVTFKFTLGSGVQIQGANWQSWDLIATADPQSLVKEAAESNNELKKRVDAALCPPSWR